MHSEKSVKPGAVVISFDLELAWGVSDGAYANGRYDANIRGAWEAIPRILDLLGRQDIAATWAVVGMLMAESRDELEAFSPEQRPTYSDPRVSTYRQWTGRGEADDPLHFGASLVRKIAATDGQEIGTHTFSHYYCLEDGQNADQFRADLMSALRISANFGVRPVSLVLPRNQHNPAYDAILEEIGIRAYRGVQEGWMYSVAPGVRRNPFYRAARLLDAYTPLTGRWTVAWPQMERTLCNVPATGFIRPVSKRLRLLRRSRIKRITRALEFAAEEGGVVHLWLHPESFGIMIEENLAFLSEIVSSIVRLRETRGLLSLRMKDIALVAPGEPAVPNKRLPGDGRDR